MWDVITAAFLPVNLVFTVLLLAMVLYWLAVILGALDTEFLNVDLHGGADAGADLDVHADVDLDGDADAGFAHTWMGHMLAFFYVGEIPVMILVSILILSMWTISVIANHYLNPTGSLLLWTPIVAANLLASLLVLKVVGRPFQRVFAALNTDANAPRPVIGRIGIVLTTQVSERIGQVEVPERGAPLLLNAITEDGRVLRKGDEAVVVRRDNERGVYIVAPVELET